MRNTTIVIALVTALSAVSAQRVQQGNGQGGSNNGQNIQQVNGNNNNNNNNNVQNQNKGTNNTTTTGSNTNNAAAANTNSNAGTGNLQTQLTLDPGQVMKSLSNPATDSTNPLIAASATSVNNFINFCATQGKPLTDGKQVQGGSCNPVPMGTLPSVNNQPAVKFQFPVNLQNIDANKDFTIKVAAQNMKLTTFNNPNLRYFSLPQTLDGNGNIIGHVHVSCQQIDSFTSTKIPDPKTFAFFNGIDNNPQGNILSVTVTGGLKAGTYRCGTITSSASHTPAVGPVAKHGVFEDIVYFTVGGANQGKAGKRAVVVNEQSSTGADNAMNSNGGFSSGSIRQKSKGQGRSRLGRFRATNKRRLSRNSQHADEA